MCAVKKLKEDLQNCIINFNNRVRVTDLLEQYDMSYTEVNEVLQQYMKQQKSTSNMKYEKRFVIYGEQMETDYIRKIFKIVEEQKLEEWLSKLEKSTSMLYSIQIQGGAKPPAEVFVPLSINKKVTLREMPANVIPKAEVEIKNIKETKEMAKPKEQYKGDDVDAVKDTPSSLSSNKGVKKPSPKSKTSPPTPKTKTQQKSMNTKGINKYFNAGIKKTEETNANKTAICSSVSGSEAPARKLKANKNASNQSSSVNSRNQKGKLNVSVPLFEEEEEEISKNNEEDVVECSSSDEEEKIEALKRDIISSDIELEERDETDMPKKQGFKRRRIEDSDDDDNAAKGGTFNLPSKKMEKLDNQIENTESKPQRTTYLDEEDFVVTIRGKSSSSSKTASHDTPTIKTEPSKSKSPNSKRNKSSPMENKKSTITKNTKQANLTSYFKKK